MRWVLVLCMLAGCVPGAVRDRITALELRVAALEAQGRAEPSPSPVGPTVDVSGRIGAAHALAATGDTEGAIEALTVLLEEELSDSDRRKVTADLEKFRVVGMPVGDLEGVQTWFQGVPPDLASGVHLLVFFEAWCPHCRRELPNLGQRVEGTEANVVLLTKLSRSSTPEQVVELLGESGVTYPTGHEDGSLSERLAVRGVPAAALVEDGVVRWRGHPARLSPEVVSSVLGVQ